LPAQQLIGYVNTRDAVVTGAADVLDGQAVLTGSVSVTAKEHTAPITLGRGGTVRVCQTSELHLTESRSVELSAPLLFSLDRGAIEIQTFATATDAIMTPDLRFTVANKGPLDLRLRLARNGDTCVENRGPGAPTLNISDPFGEALYQVSAGQHVLFEHANLHEVVDHESSPCGCPEEKGRSLADALLASGGAKPAAPAPTGAAAPGAPTVAEAELPEAQAQLKSAGQTAVASDQTHQFPAAISEGLAPAAAAPKAAPGAPHVQVGDTLSYNAPGSATAAPAPAVPDAPAQGKNGAAKQQARPSHNLIHVVGRFFKRLFGG
jgi:hypothetical protein